MAKIGIDIDGVLADFVSTYNEVIKQQTSIIVPDPSDTYPDVWEYDVAAGVTKEQLKQIWTYIGDHHHFWGMLHALPGATDALWQLSRARREHDIYFVSSRPGANAKRLTDQWLAWHGYEAPTVLITHNARDKGLIAEGLHLDVFVEDNATNLATVIGARPVITPYLVDRPYNRGKEQRELVSVPYFRVKSVTEAVDTILNPKPLREAA